ATIDRLKHALERIAGGYERCQREPATRQQAYDRWEETGARAAHGSVDVDVPGLHRDHRYGRLAGAHSHLHDFAAQRHGSLEGRERPAAGAGGLDAKGHACSPRPVSDRGGQVLAVPAESKWVEGVVRSKPNRKFATFSYGVERDNRAGSGEARQG